MRSKPSKLRAWGKKVLFASHAQLLVMSLHMHDAKALMHDSMEHMHGVWHVRSQGMYVRFCSMEHMHGVMICMHYAHEFMYLLAQRSTSQGCMDMAQWSTCIDLVESNAYVVVKTFMIFTSICLCL